MEPILKWAGGKRLLLPEIKKYISVDELKSNDSTYFEPFVGGGAVCFDLEYPKTIINDYNSEVINVYVEIKNNPQKLMVELSNLKEKYEADKNFYYEVRAWDRDKELYESMTLTKKAARTIFLNKTCYNGLYRVNTKGEFNVPIGRNKSVNIVNEKKIINLHNYLYDNDISIRNTDFADAVIDAKVGDVIYFDPPYDYEPSGFTSYNSAGFNKEDTKRLRDLCDILVNRGCTVIVSNNDTKYINELFENECYQINHVLAHRFINSDGQNRNAAKEVIIYGRKK